MNIYNIQTLTWLNSDIFNINIDLIKKKLIYHNLFFENIWLVGSSVIDILLGKEINTNVNDLDFVFFDEDNLILKKELLKFPNIFSNFFSYSKQNLNFTQGRKENYFNNLNIKITKLILIDSLRRDITITSIYINIQNGLIFDPFNGLIDIQNRYLKLNNSISLMQDHSRLIRILYIFTKYSVYNFVFDDNTLSIIKNFIDLIKEKDLISRFFITKKKKNINKKLLLSKLQTILDNTQMQKIIKIINL